MALAAGLLFALAAAVRAQPTAPAVFPVKPLRLIVGFAAGGATDFLARIAAQQLTQQLGQTVSVDNRLGARATPDGYTLTAGSSGAFSVSPHLVSKLGYDPVRDFAPVGMYSTFAYVVLVHPSIADRKLAATSASTTVAPWQQCR